MDIVDTAHSFYHIDVGALSSVEKWMFCEVRRGSALNSRVMSLQPVEAHSTDTSVKSRFGQVSTFAKFNNTQTNLKISPLGHSTTVAQNA